MSDDTPSPLNNVITIDDERIRSHLERVGFGSAILERDTRNSGPASRVLLLFQR
jgi:hypothetical protein